MKNNHAASIEKPSPAVADDEIKSTSPKWPMGKSLRLIVIVCGIFWFAIIAGLFFLLR